MRKLREVLSSFHDRVAASPQGRPFHEVEELVASYLQFSSRLDLYLQHTFCISDEVYSQLEEGVQRLSHGEPVAYVVGKQWFYGFSFDVSPDVLIPRPETELVVEAALAWIGQKKNVRCLDLCCGSGCIGITLKKMVPELYMTLIDISDRALAVAKRNAEKQKVEVSCLQCDLFDDRVYDLIVSNPPYISRQEYEVLEDSVRLFEPEIALVGGESGEEFYTRIVDQIPHRLAPGGAFICEIGLSQKETVVQFFMDRGLAAPRCIKDLQGHDRVLVYSSPDL